jgi:WxcM-like, C-terminal
MSNQQAISVDDCRIIQLPKIEDRRGNLSFIEGGEHIPFAIARTYWIYDVPGGQKRGGHAYRNLQEFVVAISGSFDVVVDDGRQRRVFSLNRSYYGLYVPNLLWRTLENFSTNALGMILASRPYEEGDYLRDYQIFQKAKA